MDSMAFLGGLAPAAARRPAPVHTSARRRGATVTTPQMGKVAIANRNKKEGIIKKVRENMERSELIFSVPLSGYTVKQMADLRQLVPSSTVVMAVKNTLMLRAIEGTEYSVAGEVCEGSNLWFFVSDEIQKTLEVLKKHNKDLKKEETNAVQAGVMDGVLYDKSRVEYISSLPSKDELYTRIAVGIKLVPTNIGRTLNALPTKLARAIKLAVADDSQEEAST